MHVQIRCCSVLLLLSHPVCPTIDCLAKDLAMAAGVWAVNPSTRWCVNHPGTYHHFATSQTSV
jgi:hypothetical protein